MEEVIQVCTTVVKISEMKELSVTRNGGRELERHKGYDP